jgi:hypothetical protein
MSVGELPVVEKIARELLRRLRLLLGNGTYNTKVKEVVRPARLESYTPMDRQIVLSTDSIEAVPELMYPGNPPAVAKRVTFNIHCNLLNDEKCCEPIDYLVHMFAADVEQVITADDSTWHTFDENAIDAEFLSHVPHNAAGGFDGVTVPIAITYRTDENNPYNVRA